MNMQSKKIAMQREGDLTITCSPPSGEHVVAKGN
jgi:hypothetical protein